MHSGSKNPKKLQKTICCALAGGPLGNILKMSTLLNCHEQSSCLFRFAKSGSNRGSCSYGHLYHTTLTFSIEASWIILESEAMAMVSSRNSNNACVCSGMTPPAR